MSGINYLNLILNILKNFQNILLSSGMKTYTRFINKQYHLGLLILAEAFNSI